NGTVGGEEAATFAPLGADNGERVAAGSAVEPAEHKLSAKPAERLGLAAKRIVGCHHLFADVALAGYKVRTVELACEGGLDVRLRQQPQLDQIGRATVWTP